MQLDEVVMLGLAIGFVVYLLGPSQVMPSVWQSFTSRFGKPFTCIVCMSFWTALILWLVFDGVTTTIDYKTVIQATASAAVSIAYVLALDKLNITILK